MSNSSSQPTMSLAEVSRKIAAEGLVLLKNEAQTLPLKNNETVALFGRCQIDTYRSGTGSGGAVNVPYSISILEGLQANKKVQLNEELVNAYQQWIELNPFDNGGGGWAAEPWFQKEMPLDDALVARTAQSSDKAVIVIGRTAGEEQDNAEKPGSYFLTELEIKMIENVTEHFSKVIIILNVSNIIDLSWLDSIQHSGAITAVLYSWSAGMEGGHALADVLSGDLSPSGRLTDSIAHHIKDYPSSANFGRSDYNLYQEDIYLGYRYFETFKPEAVMYEFGYGLSYTTFKQILVDYFIEGSGQQQVLHFDVKVTNQGQLFSAKQVVQLYVEAPQGTLGKPARSLVGFTKTSELPPATSEVVRISVPIHYLASYDDSGMSGHQSCYVLEQGHYNFHLGESIRNTEQLNISYQLKQNLCIEQLCEAMAPSRSFARIKPGSLNETNSYEVTYETVPTRKSNLAARIAQQQPSELPLSGNLGIKLSDVKHGKASLDDFIAQLSVDQLAALTRGEGMCSPKATPGTAAAFGGVTDSLSQFGIPVAAAADGPSGIRMDSGHQATQVPIGTLLACSWNSELNEQLYYLVGQELIKNNIDTLLGPGINIHRHPLNGRNFEYFSEDPLITGKIAAAQTRGLKRAGVSGTIKHFVANDQETARNDVDSVVSERALREIHLKPFEIAVKEGQASSIMTAYNPVNGHWTASNYDLTTTILRHEWGYRGIVMTDWWAKMNHPITAGESSRTLTSFMLKAQNDLYMVVEHDGAAQNASGDDTLRALENGSLSLAELQRTAINICRFLLDTPAIKRPVNTYHAVKFYSPLAERLTGDTIEQLQQIHFANTNTQHIKVEQAGVYQCNAYIRYQRDSTAQSSCNLSINGNFAMTLPVNGTKGKTVEVKGLQIELDKGYYCLDIETVMPGLELKHIKLLKQ